ncbi:MAG TPA: cobalamin-dependent protein, partial [Thermoleophilia bacterium]
MPSDTITSPGSAPLAGDVLLVFPGKHKAPDPQVPLQLLHVAGALQRAGHRVRIVDMRHADYHSVSLGDPLFVGITAMSGPQIRYGLEFARRVRAERPRVPIVWGGVHPTLLPEQTASSDCVDVVVRGEGEGVVGALANALAAGGPLDAVDGLTFKADGVVTSTPDAALVDLDSIPVELPYELLDLDRYPTLRAGRVHMQTSRGCPSRCGFCYNSGFNKRRWRGKSPQRVVDEMQHLLERFPHVKIIDPVDDNLFVNRKRVEDICNGILERGLNVAWRANCRFDYLATYDADFLGLVDLDSIPVELPYDLLDLDRYPTLRAGRVHMQTSRGCPSRCGFCYNSGFNKRRWRGKSPQRVVDEMQHLLERFPHVKIIDPVDDNLFVNRKRVEDICNAILERGLNVS